MNNNFRINQWKKQISHLVGQITKERNHLVFWFGEGSQNNLEYADKLHKLYGQVDIIINKIQNEDMLSTVGRK
jgi:hypothetical protein